MYLKSDQTDQSSEPSRQSSVFAGQIEAVFPTTPGMTLDILTRQAVSEKAGRAELQPAAHGRRVQKCCLMVESISGS